VRRRSLGQGEAQQRTAAPTSSAAAANRSATPKEVKELEVHRAHAKIRARGERAIATLTTRKIPVESRCFRRRATAVVQAILVPHHVEANRYAG
jgi:hypothetical protein